MHLPLPNRAFRRLLVSFAVDGGTRVEWEMARQFFAPGPYAFQLQVAPTSASTANDWENVGVPVDSFYAIDDAKRVYGKTLEHHYRVQLTCPDGVFYSEPASALTHIPNREWRLIRSILRREYLRSRKYTGTEVALAKARRFGPRCTECVDPQTDEIIRPTCNDCFGTGFLNGYYPWQTDIWIDMPLEDSREEMDQLQVAGTIKPIVTNARWAGFPLLNSRDVVAERRSGRRHYVSRIVHKAGMRSMPIVARVELHQAAFTDSIYDLEAPDVWQV